jgi:hypothetical protein
MIKFSAEKLVATPMVDDPTNLITQNGCGCAFGIAYLSLLEKSSLRPTLWRDELLNTGARSLDPVLAKILKNLEDEMYDEAFRNTFYVQPKLSLDYRTYIKKKLIDQLVEAGYVDKVELDATLTTQELVV